MVFRPGAICDKLSHLLQLLHFMAENCQRAATESADMEAGQRTTDGKTLKDFEAPFEPETVKEKTSFSPRVILLVVCLGGLVLLGGGGYFGWKSRSESINDKGGLSETKLPEHIEPQKPIKPKEPLTFEEAKEMSLVDLILGHAPWRYEHLFGTGEGKLFSTDELNAPNYNGKTVLFEAIESNQVESADWLIQHGASISSLPENFPTILHFAADRSHHGTIIMLLGYKEVLSMLDQQDLNGKTPLHYAALADNRHSSCELVRQGANPFIKDNNGKIPIDLFQKRTKEFAACIQSVSVPKTFEEIQSGVKPLTTKEALVIGLETLIKEFRITHYEHLLGPRKLFDETELNKPFPSDFTPTVLALDLNDAEALKCLLRHGALLDAPLFIFHHCSLLHFAAPRASEEILEILLLHGLDVNAQDDNGNTPLHLAVQVCKNHTVSYLLEHGANPKLKNKKGELPIDYVRTSANGESLPSQRCYNLLAKYEKEG